MGKTYIDKRGYLRFTDTNELVHRWVAYNQIYRKGWQFTPFSSLVVHHKDKNKLNNDVPNLEVTSKRKHRKIHNIPSPFMKFIRWLNNLNG